MPIVGTNLYETYRRLYNKPKSLSYYQLFCGDNNYATGGPTLEEMWNTLLPVSKNNSLTPNDATEMFYRCKKLTKIFKFDTSKVTSLYRTFYECKNLISVPSFDISKVTSMYETFFGCTALTSVPNLDYSNVQDLTGTFEGTGITSFSNYDLRKATKISNLFHNCSKLSKADLSKAVNAESCLSTFGNCTELTSVYLPESSKVTRTDYMFSGCTNLTSTSFKNAEVTKNMKKITNMSAMFKDCTKFTGGSILSYLYTANVTNMSYMFYGCTGLTSIPNFDTSSVRNMSYMFYGCTGLTSIPNFDTSSVTNMSYMFYDCTGLTSIPNFDTSSVTNMSYMFYDCTGLTSISNFDTSSVTNMSYMFYGCTGLTSVSLDLSSLTALDRNKAQSMFYNCSKLKSISFSGMAVTTVTVSEVINTGNVIKSITGFGLSSTNSVLSISGFKLLTSLEELLCDDSMASKTIYPSAIIDWDLSYTKMDAIALANFINSLPYAQGQTASYSFRIYIPSSISSSNYSTLTSLASAKNWTVKKGHYE